MFNRTSLWSNRLLHCRFITGDFAAKSICWSNIVALCVTITNMLHNQHPVQASDIYRLIEIWGALAL